MASKLPLPPPPVTPRRQKPHDKKGQNSNRNTIGACTDIYNDWDYSHPLSLPEFVEQYNGKLPLSIQVQTGYLGENSHATLSAFDKLNIHVVKHTKVVNAIVSAHHLSIPTNSVLEFSLLYNPNDNVDEAFKGFTFETVADIIGAKIQPKFVCCMKSWRNDRNEKFSISDRELLIIKGKCAAQKTSSTQDVLKVYSVTSSTEKTLPRDCNGHFTTNPNYLHLYLSEYILHVSNLFPCNVCVYTQKPDVRKHIEGMPQRFVTSVITLVGTSIETTLLASSVLPGFNDTIMEIPIDIPEVKIVVLSCTDVQQAQQLYENSCQAIKGYNPRYVQFVKDAVTEEDYTIQSELYSSIREGYETDGIQLKKVYECIDSKELVRPPMPLPPRGNQKQNSLPELIKPSREKQHEKISPSHPSNNVSPLELDPRAPDGSESLYTSAKNIDLIIPDYVALIGKIEELHTAIQIMQKKVERIDDIEIQIKKLSSLVRNVQDVTGSKDTESEHKGTTTSAEKNRLYLSKLTLNEVTNLLKAMGLHQYIGAFENERIDGNLLLSLDDSMLHNDLKVDIAVHRIRLLKVISGRHSAKHILAGEDPYLP